MSRYFRSSEEDNRVQRDEGEMSCLYDDLLTPSQQEHFARWLWRAKSGDQFKIGLIVVSCVEEQADA